MKSNSLQHEKDLLHLAQAIYTMVVHEDDPDQLELYRHIALKTAAVFDDAVNNESLLHPDIGLTLILFIELKRDGNAEAETYRKEAERILRVIEAG